MMKTIYWLVLPLLCVWLTGCMGGGGTTTNPPPAAGTTAASDVIRPGDKVTIRLTGVPMDGQYINEVQIPPNGQVSVPLLSQSFQATGRTTADLAAEIASAYKTEKIYTTPNVTIIPEERFVNVGGDVRSPNRVLFTSDLTLLSAINACGGFDEYANRRVVRIIRGQQVITVDCVAAARTPGGDPALYPGDQIFVPRTIF